MFESSCDTHPLASCPSVKGTASIRWVLPIFTILDHSSDFAFRASLSETKDGINSWTNASAADMCMAVGKVSLDD